jgi:DNA processing protein
MELYQLACYARHYNLNFAQWRALIADPNLDIQKWILREKKMELAEYLSRESLLLTKMASIPMDQVLYPGHSHFPEQLLYIDQPPVFLMYEGDIEILAGKSIAVVGTRRPEERFLIWMETELRVFLKMSGAVVVSGGALGIDQKASQIALRNGSGTVVVLPSGLDVPYPRGLKNHLVSQGVLYLSEYFPDESMHKGCFVRRNRLISGLGEMLLAVQFESKSGTMITVNYALAQNKEVGTLPDHPLAPLSSGNLKIIREGAHIIGSAADLISLWKGESQGPVSSRQLTLNIVPKDT